MDAPASPFAFALCQPGMERWLKLEMGRLRPDLRPAFGRPGLVSFKATTSPFAATDAPAAIFARTWSCSAGPVKSAIEAVAAAQACAAATAMIGPRDAGVPGEVPEPRQAEVEADADTWRARLRAAGGPPERAPRNGEVVFDLVTFPGEAAMAGWHVHGPRRHAGACGRFDYTVPGDLPSRAWRKMVEALRWGGLDLRGSTVVELGAAPGGGTRALVEAGARVVAIDPQPLAAEVAALPGVSFIGRAIGEVPLEALPAGAQWLACDAGIRPTDVVGALRRLLPRLQGLRGMILTLKLVDEGTIRGLPRTLRDVEGLGFEVRARQLPANRRDICVVALRAGAGRRSGRGSTGPPPR
jgi:23S rRNA (cytidine2498-2'-O)-methyltransferase